MAVNATTCLSLAHLVLQVGAASLAATGVELLGGLAGSALHFERLPCSRTQW